MLKDFKIKYLVVYMCLMIFQILIANDDKVKIVTFDLPPYSYTDNEILMGTGTELMKIMLEELNELSTINLYPEKRAKYISEREENVLIYPLERNKNNEKEYFWIDKIADKNLYIFKNKNREDISVTKIRECKEFRIGTIRGTYLGEQFKEECFDKIDEVSFGIQNLRKLLNERIDLILADELSMIHYIEFYNKEVSEKQKIKLSDLEKVIKISDYGYSKGYYIAMSKTSDKNLVKLIRNTYQDIIKKGKLIEVAHWWTNNTEKEMLKIYKEALEKKGYKWIDYTFEGGAGVNMKKVLQRRDELQHLPHAFQTYMGSALWKWAEQGVLVDLNKVAEEENWEEKIPEFIKKSIKYNGRYVAAPVNIQRVNLIWCNSRVFKESKVNYPKTWDEFFDECDKIKAAGFIPIALGGESWQEGIIFENMVLGIGGSEFYKKVFVETDLNYIDSDTMLDILNKFKKIRNYIDEDYRGRSWTKTGKMVVDGKAAMIFMGDWIKGIFEENSMPYGEFGYTTVTTPNTENIFLNNTDVFAFPKIKKVNLEAQHALAKVIMEQEVQEKFNILKGSIPVRKDISIENFDYVSKESIEAVKNKEVLLSFNFRQIGTEEIHDVVIEVISEFFNSEMTAEQAISKIKMGIKNSKIGGII